MYSQNREGHRFKTNEARSWEKTAGYLILNHKKLGKAMVILTVEFYFKTKGSDISNRMKILEDLLEKMNVIENDNQIYEEHIYKFIDNDDPRVEFEISIKP